MTSDREILEQDIAYKGRKMISENAITTFKTLNTSIRYLLNAINSDRNDTIQNCWDQLEWSIAEAGIALDELTMIYCDDPVESKRSRLLQLRQIRRDSR